MLLVDWLHEQWRHIRAKRSRGEESRRQVFESLHTKENDRAFQSSKALRRKLRQAKNGELSPEEIQHLKRRGVNINWKIDSINTSFVRKFTYWWESTSIEKFLEDIEYFLQNSAFLNIIALIAEVTIITSLFGWWLHRAERKETEIFSTLQVISVAPEDQSGVVKIALERLLRDDFSLQGLNLKNTNLEGISFQQANLRDVVFEQTNLRRADLRGAILLEANLQQADLMRADLGEANLEGAIFGKTRMPDGTTNNTDCNKFSK